jgi:hypothetical protein
MKFQKITFKQGQEAEFPLDFIAPGFDYLIEPVYLALNSEHIVKYEDGGWIKLPFFKSEISLIKLLKKRLVEKGKDYKPGWECIHGVRGNEHCLAILPKSKIGHYKVKK